MNPTRSNVWRNAGAVLVAGATVVLAACGGGPGGIGTNTVPSSYHPAKGVQGGQLVYSDWEPVEDLNVISSSAATTQEAAMTIWSGLWEVDGTNTAIPDLVEEVPSTSNGMVKKVDSTHMDVTIKLKKGLNWSDGQPLTANDVKFTWEAICDPDTGAISQVGFDHVASMEVKDNQTVIWHFGPDPTGKRCGLSAPLDSGIYAPFLLMGMTAGAGAVGPVPQHILGNVAHKDWATNAYFTQKPTATSGPYMVQDFTPGPAAQVVMVPNPHYMDGRSSSDPYFGHKPYLDKLVYKIYGDKSSQIAGLKAGDSDLGLDLIAADLPALQSISQDKTIHATGLLDEFLNFNLGNNRTGCDSQQFAASCGAATPWKDDAVVRQALDLAIDKDAINQHLVGGIGKTMNSLFVSTLKPYYDSSTPSFKRDLSKAKSMLDSDGWKAGSDGILAKGGKKLQFVISTTANNPQRAAEEEQLIANWRELGATVTTKNFPAGKFFNDFKGGGILATGQFDVGMYANNWGPDPDSWCATLESNQIPSASNPTGQNWSFINDPKLNDLCLKGAGEVDQSKRVSIYNDVEKEWKAQMPQADMYERPDVFTMSSYFGNFSAAVNTCLAICNAADWFHGKS
jgi:peptide/nickel transport system substrate-binding protein